jgi:rubrerythrin
MLEEARLRERFHSLLAKERQAADAYAELAAQTVDDELRKQIEQLHRDKLKHIRLAERLLEIVE